MISEERLRELYRLADRLLDRMRGDAGHPWAERLGAVIEAWPEGLLTQAERRALQACSYGLTTHMIAETYGLSGETIHEQIASACRRLSAKNRTQAVAIAIRTGEIQ